MANIDDDAYKLLYYKKKLSGILSRIPESDPRRNKVVNDLKGIDYYLANLDPDEWDAASHGFQQGSLFGQEGRIKGLYGKIKEAFGGEPSDYDATLQANEIVREAAKKAHPWTYGTYEYAVPMMNPLDPLAFATSAVIRSGQKLAGLAAKTAIPKGIGEVVNTVEHLPVAKVTDIERETQTIANGMKGVGAAVPRDLIKDSMLRGGVSGGIVGIGSVKDEPLEDQALGVVANTVIGSVMGGLIPATLHGIGTGITKFGDLFNNRFGEYFSRLPDRMVKKSLGNLFNISEENLKNLTLKEINWLKQYIGLVNAKGKDVVGGNRAKLMKFTGNIADELVERNQNLIDLSVDEGKNISIKAISNGIKSRFKADSSKNLVDKLLKDYATSYPPSQVRNYGGVQSEPTFNARDIYELQNTLQKEVDKFKTGEILTRKASNQKRVYEETIKGLSFAYKYLEPNISKKNPSISMKQNASEIRSLLSLQRRLEHSLNKDEAKIVNNLGPTRAFETGALTYGLAHALGSTTPLNWGLTAAGLKIGGRVLSKIGRKNYLSPRFKYNVGSGLSGHVPVMMGGNLARPVGAALDMYKTAREASPPEQEPVQGPSPSEVDDFSGFGSSQEWINKQLGN